MTNYGNDNDNSYNNFSEYHKLWAAANIDKIRANKKKFEDLNRDRINKENKELRAKLKLEKKLALINGIEIERKCIIELI